MFFLTNKKESDTLQFGGSNFSLNDLKEQNIDKLIAGTSENRHLDSAFNILFMTHHPGEDLDTDIMMQVSPGQYFYLAQEVPCDTFQKLKLHRHDFLECMFVIEGNTYQNIEYKRHYYPEGSCCLMNRNVYHQEESSSYQRLAFLQLSAGYLLDLLTQAIYFEEEHTAALHKLTEFVMSKEISSLSNQKKYIDFIPAKNAGWIKNNVHRCLEEILLEMQAPSVGSTYRVNALMLELMEMFFDERHFRNAPVSLGTKNEQLLFSKITQYMTEHDGRFTRTALESHFNYSSDYLYKIVHKYTGLSLFDYGMSFCMNKAAVLLTTTNMSLEDIMQLLCFNNQTHFYKLFKEYYGMTPAKYRRECLKKGSDAFTDSAPRS